MTNPEDVTSQSLVDSISKNPWVKARAGLIREYAIMETALSAADEIEALINSDNEQATFPALYTTLTTWISVTRESAVMEVVP